MSSVLMGLQARRDSVKKAIKQALDDGLAAEVRGESDARDDALWDLQRQLESLHAQIVAYEKTQISPQ